MSEIIIEKLLEQRDFYLNTLKHLEFQLILESTESELDNIKKSQIFTIEQLKKIEQELTLLMSDNS